MLDVPLQLASFLAELLADHRRGIGNAAASPVISATAPTTAALAARTQVERRLPGTGRYRR
jgi:hypothetical protein